MLISKEKIKEFVLNNKNDICFFTCEAIITLAGVSYYKALKKSIKNQTNTCPCQTDIYVYDYSDAIESISNSNMPSGDKVEAIKALITDESDEYYEAVVKVVESHMACNEKLAAMNAIPQKIHLV